MECVILGSLTALGMTIFQFPYAPLVGVMVAILSWIPMFGVYIGAGIGALLMLTSNPIDAIWFIVFMICLQQIEGKVGGVVDNPLAITLSVEAATFGEKIESSLGNIDFQSWNLLGKFDN